MQKFQLPPEYDTEELQKLVGLFPQFWRESYFDFDEMKAYLGGLVQDDLQEKYSFTWHGKQDSYRLLKKNSHGTLRPCREDSVDWDTTQNLYIEGDNLEVLKLIKHTYAGENGVKMIYIDPPYNTGNDFVYDDDFMDSLDKYLEYTGQKGLALPEASGRYHTHWLNMMYPRLWLANYLLRDDGVIFISIDDNEVHNLRKLCDEVFGEENFVGSIGWESKTKSQNTVTSFNKLQPKIEYIAVYTKANMRRFNLFKKGEKEYSLSDERGEYREHILELMNADGIRGRETMVFSIEDGVSTVSPPAGKQWQLGQDQVATYKSRSDLFIRDNKVVIKMRPDDERTEVTEPFWAFLDKTVGTAESAKKELSKLVPDHGFETVKPVELLKRLVYHATNPGDIILDFFSGSATTAHAVMQVNSEYGGDRKFILLQLPEPTKNELYPNICEIGKERIRRAGAKIAVENPNVDVGFRVFKLDKSNFKVWDDSPVDAKNAGEVENFHKQLEIFADSPFIEGRTHDDIVYEIMRMNNIPLTTPIMPIELSNGTVYGVGEDCDFIICLDVMIDDTAAEELCKYRPGRILFTDSCFKNTEMRMNVEHTIRNINSKIKMRVV